VRCWGFTWCFFLIMQDVSIMTIIWKVLVWPITPYLCPKLAASSDWLCGVGDALGWLDQLLLELAQLLPSAWPAPPGCLPCTSWMLDLLLLDSAWSCYETMFTVVMSWGCVCVIESVELLWMFWGCCDELKCVYVLCWWFFAQTRISDVHVSYLYYPHSLEVLTTHRSCMHE
jgi:hypothetical protein